MSRESLIIISRLIVAAVFIASVLAMALGEFFITLITVSGGLIIWLLYLLAADLGTSRDESGTETTLGKTLSKIMAGLGGVLAVSAFKTYGVEQTIWGGYAFDLAGLALALAVLWVSLMPLVILQLLSKPGMPPAYRMQKQAATLSEDAQPPTTTEMPEQQLYYGTPYPQEPDPHVEGEYIEYEEGGEEWAGEAEEEEDYYEDEEGDEYEDEEEYEEDEGEDEDVR
ncbi:hypothetical protein ES707_04336 [subsurface metagenome]